MLRSSELIKDVERYLIKIQRNKAIKKQLDNFLEKQYNYVGAEYMQYVIGAKELRDMPDRELFWFIAGINEICNAKIKLKEYYSEWEYRQYSTLVAECYTIEKYPTWIENVQEIAEDQWVAVEDINFLKDLYDKQLIMYNPKTQRQMKRNEKDGAIFYTIDVNKASVKEIQSLLEQKKFIPNDLTLNLNVDNPQVDFDVKDNSIILLGGQFDIIDGFHRFKAAINAKAKNPDFNCKFIINIMNFNEAKACQYIAQQDKRNKISTSYVKSLDIDSPTNIIVEKINTSPDSLLRGKIQRGEVIDIDRAFFFSLIEEIYKTKKANRSQCAKIANHIISILNLCVDAGIDLRENSNLAIAIYGSYIHADKYEAYESILKALNTPLKTSIVSVNRKTIQIIIDLFEEV